MSIKSKNKAPEIVKVSKDIKTVMCDGGEGALGHPAVYYSFDDNTRLTCGYCDKEFVKK